MTTLPLASAHRIGFINSKTAVMYGTISIAIAKVPSRATVELVESMERQVRHALITH